ncbi:Type II/IV secretion system protein TadC, Flp pilus assembly [Liberibacter crescens BT-1]|uniref:Type II/IV secretion system protein TadC, Flp pilus assembly n=2 Tax=Liberibacter crescens TaxID=1273132 RepID=L0EY10_LIBCB|nr:type II secretion system F family protein [Liberibacter crescens]AGA65271.1 Type II/IV secretion system protein TadC, Flp pilus assembly [Liberibacter crescens BT-1]
MIALCVMVSVFSAIYSVVIPYLDRNQLESRMKSVALEREFLRNRQRAQMKDGSPGLRDQGNTSIRKIVETFNLREVLVDENTVNKLRAAGFRSEYALNLLLVTRFLLPFLFLIFGFFLIFILGFFAQKPLMVRVFIVCFIGYIGFYAPNIFISNLTSKRQAAIKRVWPDALDLMLICVESGLALDHSLRRVAEEIASQSAPLAEEILITTAELSFLPERQTAFENFANRTQLDCVRTLVQSLIQADRYGTSIGQSLRVLAEEGRTERMTEAEKKAAALPPKLTVPMIIFFLPVLMMIILGPAILNVMDYYKKQ